MKDHHADGSGGEPHPEESSRDVDRTGELQDPHDDGRAGGGADHKHPQVTQPDMRPASRPARGWSHVWLRDLGVFVVGTTACSAVIVGVLQLTGSVHVTARLLGMWLAAAAVGMVVFHGVLGPLMARDTAGSLKPRTFTSRFMVLGGLAMMAGVAVVVLIGLLPTGPTLASVPGLGLAAAGLLAMFALVRHLSWDRGVDPRG